MITRDPVAVSAAMRDAAKAFLRIDGSADDAALTALIGAAIVEAETFSCAMLIARDVAETLELDARWRTLGAGPVTAITAVTAIGGSALPVGAVEIDIDTHGDGRLRARQAAIQRVRVGYRAGLVEDWPDLPEPLRHGVLRLVALLHAARDGAGAVESAPVLATLRPHRRMKLS